MEKKKKIGVLGLSHMGMVVSVGFAEKKWETIAVSPDADHVGQLQRLVFPISEPNLLEMAHKNREHLFYSDNATDLSDLDFVLITLDTPTNDKNEGDISAVTALVDWALPHFKENVVIALMSQSPIGYTESLKKHIAQKRAGFSFRLYHWVETLVIGNAMVRFLTPERIIIGLPDEEKSVYPEFAELLNSFGSPVLPMSYRSAEMSKAAINFYLSTSVTYANTLADLCETVGAKMSEIIPALRLDKRIGTHAYITPGLGLSGGNLERDLVMMQGLFEKKEQNSAFLNSIIDYNADRLNWLTRMLEMHLFQKTAHPKITVAGVAYKKDTKSTKNSPALRFIPQLSGRAEIMLTDPMADWPGGPDFDGAGKNRDIYQAVEGADCLVLLTNWDEYSRLDLERLAKTMKRLLIIDGVHVLSQVATKVSGTKMEYFGMGNFPNT